ncbi:MAG: efflux RND transporter periplasmic adaptor subunit [Mariprofundaceae bacterium]|nr:efflux RND transporter periplasmic adaptor subunit [Mariprofundaceae bacterium]
MKSRVFLGISILSMIALTACSDDAKDVSHVLPSSVVAEQLTLTLKEVPIYYMTSGMVTSDHRVAISSRLSGYIRDIKVREGDQVSEGQVLLHIDPVNAKQALVRAKADVNNAKLDMQRYESLLHEGAVTSQQFDKVKLRYQVAKSQVKQAKHQLSYAEVSSPMSGVVVEKRMEKGDLASPGMPILILEDPSSLLVQTYASEQFVAQIDEGDAVDVEIASLKRHFKGVVRQIVEAADPVSHQFLVKVSLPSMEDIHPGMFAQTGFHVGMRKALLIPEAAVITQAGLNAVYVTDAASVAHYRLIRIGKRQDNMLEILAGLHDGDHIVWAGKPALRSGMKVHYE